MIMLARSVMRPVHITAYTHVMFAVIFRFFSFGDAISRYTCASVSNPLMERSECPKAAITAMAEICSQRVPASHPCASGENCKFDGMGAGGRKPQRSFTNSVIGPQIKMIATITVV